MTASVSYTPCFCEAQAVGTDRACVSCAQDGKAHASADWRPLVLDASDPSDAGRLDGLLRVGRVWQVHDTLMLQLRDLIRAQAPQRSFSDAELDREIEQTLGGCSARAYGRWIYYAWSGRLVHTLPPAEFRRLRLDRNRNKITAQEQDRLACVSVGVVGLSIGNAVAVALAMEGIGHLRLADFDSLDLSNMNRLRAGIHEIGLPKTVLAARQIYEIDPYVSIVLATEGITENNVDEFLMSEPRLDVLVEECDSVPIKFLLRERAREHRIPVLMETSDQGMFDVERFDTEPDRPLFHGLVGSKTAAQVRQANRDERVALVLSLLDPDRLSTRIAASLAEVDRSLSTWPQLASDVALGAATVGTAVRSIALGEEVRSGRRFIDVRANVAAGQTPAPVARPQALPLIGAAEAGETDPSIPDVIRFVVEHATLAPSGGNSQPWHFYYDGNVLWLTLDPVRARNTMDTPMNGVATLALGAAVENCVIAAAHRGLRSHVEPYPDSTNSLIAAALRFQLDGSMVQSEAARMFPFIKERATNRRLGPRIPVSPQELKLLRETASAHGAHLEFITNPTDLDEVGHILGEADRIRFLCRPLHAEMIGEIRWTPDEARERLDGLDIGTLELAATDYAAMRVIGRPDVAAFLRERNEGVRIAEAAEKAVAAASAVGVLSIPCDTAEAWLQGGRALERVWLAATANGLAFHPWISVLYMIAMLDRPIGDVFNARERATLRTLATKLSRLFPEVPGAPRAVLFRLGYAPEPGTRSVRLPVDRVLHGLRGLDAFRGSESPVECSPMP